MKDNIIRRIYLYLVTFVGIIIFVIGTIQLLNLGLKAWVFKQADFDYYSMPLTPEGNPSLDEEAYKKQSQQNRTAQKQREASNAIAMIVVGYPLYAYHWRTLRREK